MPNNLPRDLDEGLDPELKCLSTSSLEDRINIFEDRYAKISRDRNHMQLEKDMITRFYDIAKQEVRQVEAQIIDKDRDMDSIQLNHRVQIKVHENSIHRLAYNHKDAWRSATQERDAAIQDDRESHSERARSMNHERLDISRDRWKQQLKGEEGVEMIRSGFAKNLRRLRESFERRQEDMQAQYERQVEELKADLELEQRVNKHRIEEMKNTHINALLIDHQASFNEVKSYKINQTRDMLELIKTLRSDIHELKEQKQSDQKEMQRLALENRELVLPLEETQKRQRQLEESLKRFPNDKMALQNRQAQCKRLEESFAEAMKRYRVTEEAYRRAEHDRDDHYCRIHKVVRETKRKTQLAKNTVLEKKLEKLTSLSEEKQAQLSEVILTAKLDPAIVAYVTHKLQNITKASNAKIKESQYQLHEATTLYSETIRVCEAKLLALGIQPEETSFEELPPSPMMSTMPTRLVARAR